VALAWDRRRLLAKCRRAASKVKSLFAIVTHRKILAQWIARLEERSGRGMRAAIHNRLVQLEQRFYKQIRPPDLVFRLNVSIQTAKLRNRARMNDGRDSDDFIEIRHRNNNKWNRAGTRHIVDLDAEPSISEIMDQVKKGIWNTI
jgi:thymidylate kinase